jgi:hypothetical protein
MRNRISRTLPALLLTLALCWVPVLNAQAFDTPEFLQPAVEPFQIGFDVLMIRPLSFVALVVGGVMFVPAIIMSAPNLTTTYDEAVEVFIMIPYEGVFERPLGDF